MDITLTHIVDQLRMVGLSDGDKVMVHSSFRATGISDPDIIIQALLEVVGESGTLLMPALSYLQTPPDVHDSNFTPTCVGFLTEYFRKRFGTKRSLHPTHSVCAIGRDAASLLDDHIEDNSPCGPHSPFNKLLHCEGKILMLGCGLRPNTTMHAIEEYAAPPYLFGPPLVYTITDRDGRTFQKQYITHDFEGYIQRYDRVAELLSPEELVLGNVGNAATILIQCRALFSAALDQLQKDPFCFVDKK